MDEKPKLFIVSETGSYHFIGGQEPHLVEHCTAECEPGAVFEAMAGSTLGFQNSGCFVDMPTTTTTITFDSH